MDREGHLVVRDDSAESVCEMLKLELVLIKLRKYFLACLVSTAVIVTLASERGTVW